MQQKHVFFISKRRNKNQSCIFLLRRAAEVNRRGICANTYNTCVNYSNKIGNYNTRDKELHFSTFYDAPGAYI
jgi:hypothetical protein